MFYPQKQNLERLKSLMFNVYVGYVISLEGNLNLWREKLLVGLRYLVKIIIYGSLTKFFIPPLHAFQSIIFVIYRF